MSTRIDTHQHFWRLARGDYDWLDPQDAALRPLVRDFEPEDLLPLLRAHGVAQTVVVQAAATEAETDHLLGLADRHPWIGGVVGWIDLADPRREAVLERWARHPRFKGVRPMLQDLPDPDWIAKAPHPDMVRALIRLGLRLDALVKPPHLAGLLKFLARWPELRVVVDHAAKPVLREGWRGSWVPTWEYGLARLAEHPGVCCKFSALLTEASASQVATVADAIQAVRSVWQRLQWSFGAQRLMWGSDWPVLTLAGDYARWVAVSEALIGELSPSDQTEVWSGTARRFYDLTERVELAP